MLICPLRAHRVVRLPLPELALPILDVLTTEPLEDSLPSGALPNHTNDRSARLPDTMYATLVTSWDLSCLLTPCERGRNSLCLPHKPGYDARDSGTLGTICVGTCGLYYLDAAHNKLTVPDLSTETARYHG